MILSSLGHSRPTCIGDASFLSFQRRKRCVSVTSTADRSQIGTCLSVKRLTRVAINGNDLIKRRAADRLQLGRKDCQLLQFGKLLLSPETEITRVRASPGGAMRCRPRPLDRTTIS